MRVVAVSGDGPELSQLLTGPNLRHEVVTFGRMLDPWRDLVAVTKLWRLCRRERFDILHSTTPKAGLISAVAAFLAGVPVRLHTFTGQPWVDLHGPIRWFARLSDRIIGWLSTRCYADSATQRDFLVQEGLVSARKIDVIGTGSLAGVNLARFDPARWSREDRLCVREQLGIPASARVLLFIGRIARDKGVAELLQAFAKLVQDNYDVDLIVVGPLDEECGGKGYLTAAQLRAYRRVHYVGYSGEPERFLAIADALCLPSYREGFGTVVIEAAAMAVPTVGTRINGLIDAVVDGVTGVLVPVRDVDSLFVTLARLLEQPERMAEMGNQARARCQMEFDANVVNQKLVEEYARLLAQCGR
jgi:glycosyltransferase involved in cell wall biosynthesis